MAALNRGSSSAAIDISWDMLEVSSVTNASVFQVRDLWAKAQLYTAKRAGFSATVAAHDLNVYRLSKPGMAPSPPAPSPPNCTLLPPGAGIGHGFFLSKKVVGAAACCSACAADPRCVAFTSEPEGVWMIQNQRGGLVFNQLKTK